MVTSVQPVAPSVSVIPAGSQAQPAQRSISEAKRLLNENGITGAGAMRILAMLDQAEQHAGKGNSVNAQRIARKALKQVRELSVSSTPSDSITPTDREKKTDTVTEESTDPKTPLVNQNQRGVMGDPSQQETVTYQDGSNDSGVSFQYAQPVSAIQSQFAVRQHELSHIRRDTSEAILNGQKVLTSVRLHRGVNPSTGKPYVSGGQARIIIFPENKSHFPSGNNINVKA